MYTRFKPALLAPFLCVCVAHSVMAANEPMSFSEVGRDTGYFTYAASARFVVADVDGDGRQDFVFSGVSDHPMLLVLGTRQGSLGLKQITALPYASRPVRLVGWNDAGDPHVIAVLDDGTASDFSGWPLTQARTIPIAPNAVGAAIGDADADGHDDLVVLTQDTLYAYSIDDGHAEWSVSVPAGYDVEMAQLDADAAAEIVIGSTPGVVLDGATRAIDWEYAEGFGYRLATGHLDDDGSTQWVGAVAWATFGVFDSTPWSLAWSGTTPLDIGAVATADLDGNGRDVVLIGDGQWGQVHVFDSATHQERFHIDHSGWGVNAIASGDLNGDGHVDIGFTSSAATFGDSLVDVVDASSGQPIWNFVPSTSPFTSVALGDVDGDGQDEVVAAGLSNGSFGTVAVYDFESGVEEWRSADYVGIANDPYFISAARIGLVPHANGVGMDIVLAGTAIFDGRISVIDGTTMQSRLMIGSYSEGPMSDRPVYGLVVLDYDGDGTQDYAVATGGSDGAHLQVFSGTDGHSLWLSPQMGQGWTSINDVLLTDSATGPSELIAVLPDSLWGYSVESGLLDWSLPATNVGAAYVRSGVAGAEIAVVHESGALTFYDAADRSYLRSFVLSAPSHSVDALNGDVHTLLTISGDRMQIIDGSDATVRAQTGYLGPFPNTHPAVKADGKNWNVVSGSMTAVYRHRLQYGDAIFGNSFESP